MAALDGLTGAEKAELVCSLSALLCADAGADLSEENISSVITASGNKVEAYWAPAFAAVLAKAGGVEKFLKAPGSGKSAPGLLV